MCRALYKMMHYLIKDNLISVSTLLLRHRDLEKALWVVAQRVHGFFDLRKQVVFKLEALWVLRIPSG